MLLEASPKLLNLRFDKLGSFHKMRQVYVPITLSRSWVTNFQAEIYLAPESALSKFLYCGSEQRISKSSEQMINQVHVASREDIMTEWPPKSRPNDIYISPTVNCKKYFLHSIRLTTRVLLVGSPIPVNPPGTVSQSHP